MLSLEDCIAFSELTPDQLEAIAHHEHMSMVVAAEWAECLVCTSDGCKRIEGMLRDEIAHALRHGDADVADKLTACLRDFRVSHLDAGHLDAGHVDTGHVDTGPVHAVANGAEPRLAG